MRNLEDIKYINKAFASRWETKIFVYSIFQCLCRGYV